tara:strand:+ start:1864 stop:2313 length:450 start_codon:yes stop_codon:yes gene_type:complete
MTYDISLISKKYSPKLIFIKNLKQIILEIFSLLFFVAFLFTFFPLNSVDASTVKNEKLIEKISKDYTNKFCNSVAFGLSKDSAMSFANKENNLIFKRKKGVEIINKDLIANSISVSVVENCGYLVDLYGEEGIDKFKRDYLSINNSIQE